ncbi:hypothetical protein IV203_010888 [Nitzschia inconspicua]|uniref:Uncharacterized protein n=1 Tax=Nitzschia inconspicua TaxID=303405 RepID=A0A9K3KYI3_9STRA|nr:hypothetical protein IV203_010888 [Nitzschia inconspicua]
MPPFSGDSMFCSSNAAYDTTTPVKPETVTEEEAPTSEKNGRFDALLDFNPCVSVSGAGHSMSSAMFKTRQCSWCGQGCNKLKGYNKEVVEGTTFNEETGVEEPTTTKIYFHKWCSQLKEWKEVHQEGWKKVMDGLIGHFRAIELAEQRRREAEERARQEAIRRADEARRAAEEKRRQEEEERRVQEEERLAAEEAQRKRQASVGYKVGKKLSAFKKAVTSPCKSKKAVDEKATGEEQYPDYEY